MSARDWKDDPDIQQRMRERAVRNGLVRTVVIWSPLFLLSFGALLFVLFDVIIGGGRGTWFLVAVLILLSTLFGFQAIHALLDLLGEPRLETALVMRKWARNDSLVLRTHYIRLERGQILHGERALVGDLKAGDRVSVRYYHHSAVIIELERLKPEPPPEDPAAATS